MIAIYALADWNKAIELDPANIPAHVNRGSLRLENRDIGGAIADFRKASELSPGFKNDLRQRLLSGSLPIGDTVIVVAERASIKSQGQVVDTAVRGTDLPIRGESGGQFEVRFRRAGLIDRADAMPLDEAIAHFTEAIRRRPEDSRAYGARGNAWAFKGDLEKALADHDRAVAPQPARSAGVPEARDRPRAKGQPRQSTG